jgi:ribosome biogenesis GTPase
MLFNRLLDELLNKDEQHAKSIKMTLEQLGYSQELEDYRRANGFDSLDVARVIAEHKERYVVKTEQAELDAEILGNLRFTAQSRADFPAVGDWVAISVFDDNKALIHAIFPRKTLLERQAVGKKGEKQIIASNIDCALIVQSIDRDFSINRIQRYLTICNSSNIQPVIVLTKIDLIDKEALNDLTNSIKERIENVPVFTLSNLTEEGITELQASMKAGKTYCLLGSSGVGKSSLLNALAGEAFMKTKTISSHTGKGQHATTHRELRVLDGGAIIIDNPGMREVGIADSAGGLEQTFELIHALSTNCKFKNCTHTNEIGCAVIAALERGELDQSSYDNYLKLEREKAHYESTVAEKRQKDKDFGKMVKHYKRMKNSNKY